MPTDVASSSRLGPVTRQHVPLKRGMPSRYGPQSDTFAFLMMFFMSATVTRRWRCRSPAWSTTQYLPLPSASLAHLNASIAVDGPATHVTCCYIMAHASRVPRLRFKHPPPIGPALPRGLSHYDRNADSRDESRDELVVLERVSVGFNGLDGLQLTQLNYLKQPGFMASPIGAIRQSATFTRWKP